MCVCEGGEKCKCREENGGGVEVCLRCIMGYSHAGDSFEQEA